MNARTIIRMARPFRAVIGAHVSMIGDSSIDYETYQRARAESDLAVQHATYLIQHLKSRHDAVLFARAVGMAGYINNR